VSCLDDAGAEAAPTTCPARAPATEAPCNTLVCPNYTTLWSPWEECSLTCGNGTQTASAVCYSTYGAAVFAPAPIDNCAAEDTSPRQRRCNTDPCGEFRWGAHAWGPCSVACGGGVQQRQISCWNVSSGVEVHARECEAALPDEAPPAAEQTCAPSPCAPAVRWTTSEWSACSADCDGGVMERTRTCVATSTSDPAEEALCEEWPKPPTSAPCNTTACDFCKAGRETCSGRGTCDADMQACACEEGYSGALCEEAVACDGGSLGPANVCCMGNWDILGECCLAGSALDASGVCCPNSQVDACGVCGGDARVVDVMGACCAGVLDSGGVCCASSAFDECGVCDGDSSTCAITASVQVDAGADDMCSAEFNASFEAAMADALGVNVTRISVGTAVALDTNAEALCNRRRHLLAEPVSVSFQVQPPSQDEKNAASAPRTTISDVQSQLAAAVAGSGEPTFGIALLELEEVARAPVCDNQVCESGESGETCPEDCPDLKQCPSHGDNSMPCCGVGRCIPSTGTCECFAGTFGAACGECAEGYFRKDGVCKLRPDRVLAATPPGSPGPVPLGNPSQVPNSDTASSHPENDAGATGSSGGGTIIIAVGAAGGAGVLALIGCMVYVKRRSGQGSASSQVTTIGPAMTTVVPPLNYSPPDDDRRMPRKNVEHDVVEHVLCEGFDVPNDLTQCSDSPLASQGRQPDWN